jgi:hypothetical protein
VSAYRWDPAFPRRLRIAADAPASSSTAHAGDAVRMSPPAASHPPPPEALASTGPGTFPASDPLPASP